MGRHVLQIIVCYIVGIIAGGFIFATYLGQGLMGFALAFSGAILGLPLLLVAVVIFVSLKTIILRNLWLWCLGAPFIVVLLWQTILEWGILNSSRGQDLYWYLSSRNFGDRAALAFTCASIS